MGGGAWPFLVGGVICLVNSVNERDYNMLNSQTVVSEVSDFLEGLAILEWLEVCSNNRSVMPLDVLGRARATLTEEISAYIPGPRGLGNLETPSWLGSSIAIVGRERGIPSKRWSLTSSEYVPALCTHRPSLLPIG